MSLLAIRALRKSFGTHTVLDDISLEVPEGSIFGFIGENGAGKTTTMKIILGLLRADAGAVEICSERVRFGQTPTNRFVGYLPDVPQYYGYMRPLEYLQLCGEVSGLYGSALKSRAAELLELVGLPGSKKRIGTFSRGMRQRLGVAQALINQPRLLICDEPTSALDPIGRKDILDVLLRIRNDTTVIFSTHILSDVERICDRVAVLHGGKIVLNGSLAELKAKRGADEVRLDFANAGDKAEFLAAYANAPSFAGAAVAVEAAKATVAVKAASDALREDADELEVIVHLDSARITQALSASGVFPERMEVLQPSIESLFLEAVQ